MKQTRYRVTQRMPEPTRKKNGLKVGDLVPERWGENQLRQWIRLGRVEEVEVAVAVQPRSKTNRGGTQIETTDASVERETRWGERETIEGEGEGQEAQRSGWKLKTPPGEYLERYPDGRNADLARRILAAEGEEA